MVVALFKRTNKVKVASLTIILVILTLLISCGVDPLTGIDSPDGKKIAMVYVKRISKSKTHVSIISRTQSIPRKGNVARFNGLVALDIEWLDNNSLVLVVSDSDKDKIDYINNQFESISITVQ